MLVFGTVLLLAAQTGGLPDWQWDTKSPICVLTQEIGDSRSIEIRRTPANDETQVNFALSKRAGLRDGRIQNATLELLPAGTFSADGVIMQPDKDVEVSAITSDPAFIEKLASSTSVILSLAGNAPIGGAIRSARAAVQALRECEDRKMRAWGINAAAWRGLQTGPIPLSPVRDSFSALDYPDEAMSAHIEADAIIQLIVGTDGTVRQCRGLNPGDYKGFEAASCRVLNKARFKPAVDAAGTAVEAPIIYDVVFRLEDE